MNDIAVSNAAFLPDPNSLLSPVIDFMPAEIAGRRAAVWRGMQAESVRILASQPFEYYFRAPYHLLLVTDRAARFDGETSVEGLPKSNLRDLSRKLTFVPAGSQFRGWAKPRVLSRITCIYIDPHGGLLDPKLGFDRIAFKPQLFFFDQAIWETAQKLKAEIGECQGGDHFYAEALGGVLCHELMRLNGSDPAPAVGETGGLAEWQKKKLVDYIETYLDQPISIAAMAALVRLSPYHFARAFKRSFGVPPHRYHMMRRIEATKILLGKTSVPVTEIALRFGFSETSSFTAGFRRLTGLSPSEYRRTLG
ncbi:MAG: helix-turn-helix domain-containing protein [Methylovirgula sp.]